MPWPLIKLAPHDTKFKFVRFAIFAAFLSVFCVAGSIVSVFTGGLRDNPIQIYQAAQGDPLAKFGAVMARGFNLGIDFKGGSTLTITAPQPIDTVRLSGGMETLNLGEITVQNSGQPTRALLRFQTPGANPDATVQRVRQRIIQLVPGVSFGDVEVVSAKVSEELFSGGLIALGLAILMMLIYIWIRFEPVFGVGAVLALFHDTILTLGLFSVTRIEFTLTIIAALLTIIGYSMNDTVVVFDRLRENLRKYKRMPLPDVIDLSTNETLSRTMITSFTALLAAVALWIWGGDTLRGFAIAMTFGIVIGTYSSIYVAAPAILIWGVKRSGDRTATPKGVSQPAG